MVPDRRQTPRAETDLAGRIVPVHGQTIGCTVRDRSQGGARLRVNSVLGIPDTFRLDIPATGEQLRARVVWKAAGNVGVVIE